MSKIKQLFRFLLPVLVLPVLSGTLPSVPAVVAGMYLGSEALAAASASSRIISMLSSVLYVIAVAAPAATAILAENGKLKSARTLHIVAFIIFMNLFLSVTAIEILIPSEMMKLMSLPESVIDMAAGYLRGYAVVALLVVPVVVLIAQLVRRYSMILTMCLCGGLMVLSVVVTFVLTVVLGMGVNGLGFCHGIFYTAGSVLPFAMIPVAKLYRSFGAPATAQ